MWIVDSSVSERGLKLLHSDRGFGPFEEHLGLRVARQQHSSHKNHNLAHRVAFSLVPESLGDLG